MSEIRGWLRGLIEGSCDIDEVDEIISVRMTKARDHAYRLGVIDGRIKRIEKPCSEVTGVPARQDLTPFGISVRGSGKESFKSAFLGKVLNEFKEVAVKQEIKGIEKYGHELRPSDNYNWLDMALEELVDAVKYLVAEKAKRGEV